MVYPNLSLVLIPQVIQPITNFMVAQFRMQISLKSPRFCLKVLGTVDT